jgi:hypothetical protein
VKHGGAKGWVQSAGASSKAQLTRVGQTGWQWLRISVALAVLRQRPWTRGKVGGGGGGRTSEEENVGG